jgi:hypothetical protein
MFRSYKITFGQHLKELDLENLGNKQTSELEILLMDVQFQVETRQSTKNVRSKFLNGIYLVENAGENMGLYLEGLSEEVAQDDDILECVDEITLKYCPKPQDPRIRLALSMATICYKLDSKNRPLREKNEIQRKVSPEHEKLTEGL